MEYNVAEITKFLPRLHTSLYNIPPTPGQNLTVPVVHSVDRKGGHKMADSGRGVDLLAAGSGLVRTDSDGVQHDQHIGDPGMVCPEFPESSVKTTATQLPVTPQANLDNPRLQPPPPLTSSINPGNNSTPSMHTSTNSLSALGGNIIVSSSLLDTSQSTLEQNSAFDTSPVVLLDPNILTAIQDLNNTLASVNLET